jgi:hypothetical protein
VGSLLTEYLQSVNGIQIYGIAMLLFSIVLFAWIVFRARRADKAYIHLMEQLPLDTPDGPAHDLEKAHS